MTKSAATQKVSLSVGNTSLDFTITRDAYNKYLNALTPTNKVAPSHNFLVSTVDEGQQDTLAALLQANPGAELQLAGAVLEAYVPDLNIVVKTRSA